MAKYNSLAELFTATADAIRAKTGGTDPIVAEDFPIAVEGISAGGGAVSVAEKDVNFYDYDGTCLHSYTVAEAQALTELPPLPEQKGLICQGWNWSLEDIKAHNRAINVGAMYITDDGTTRIYITLQEGMTSPVLGVCPNGTVTVDWGDGTTPDALTGTDLNTLVWTPTHNYAKPGDYVIRLTVDGQMAFKGVNGTYLGAGILRYSSANHSRNYAYRNAVQMVEIGNGVTHIGAYSFYYSSSLASITIPNSVTSISYDAFTSCYSLASITIPNSVTSIVNRIVKECYSATSVSIPSSLTSIGTDAFASCYSLASITIPNSVTSIGSNALQTCACLPSIIIPDGVTSIASGTFASCPSLVSITISSSVTSIDTRAFSFCNSVLYYDFTKHTAVPTLSSTDAFSNIPADCEIRVPAALYDEWKAATNWATYASNIVAV